MDKDYVRVLGKLKSAEAKLAERKTGLENELALWQDATGCAVPEEAQDIRAKLAEIGKVAFAHSCSLSRCGCCDNLRAIRKHFPDKTKKEGGTR